MKFHTHFLIATLAAAFALDAHSATQGSAKPGSDSTQIGRIAGQYTSWAGSNANAVSLVSGLRHGSSITLTPAAQLGVGIAPQTTSVSFTPETRPMGWGNVTKTLSLAQSRLAASGINNPTPQQLQAALTGGDITSTPTGTALQTTHVDGILTMRSQGLGWGQIAQNLNLKPGASFKPSGTTNQGTAFGIPGNGPTVAGRPDDEESTEIRHEHLLSNPTAHASSGTAMAAHTANSPSTITHNTHSPISHVVNATGTPMATSAVYQNPNHGNDHAASNFTSHVTTAGGNGYAVGLGHAANPGKAMGHGNH